MKLNIETEFQNLLNDCKRQNARESLARIKAACESQLERGSKDFSIATIVKILKGKPGESTIRNKQGARYRKLINVYQEVHGPKPEDRKAILADSWVNEIERSDIRWLVNDLLAENRKLRNELNDLKTLTRKEGKIEIDMRPSTATSSQNSPPQLAKIEKDTLSNFISPENLNLYRLRFDSRGRLVSQDGEYLSGPKLEHAIIKILSIGYK
tara:strand:- start:95 stop:727 length:633 start_codon:yes stop_codon:yes gene_type:complete